MVNGGLLRCKFENIDESEKYDFYIFYFRFHFALNVKLSQDKNHFREYRAVELIFHFRRNYNILRLIGNVSKYFYSVENKNPGLK